MALFKILFALKEDHDLMKFQPDTVKRIAY